MSTDALIGTRLANYRIQRMLGRGGMATVYYGVDVKLHRPVAIKIIDARYQGDVAFAKRFIDEARMVARWRHENIIHVYYADKQGDLYFFAMEYIEGMSLADLMADYTATDELMPHNDVLLIGRAVASALDYAHSKDVIHRDIKPSNVLIGQDNRVVLADFGLALDVQQGTIGEVFGTPHYISPEQARSSADAVPQSDLYSLGVMLYEMLTGSVPFDDPSAATLALQHLTAAPPLPRSINPQLNTETENVLLKMLAKTPKDRYQTGSELIQALENALSAQPSDERDSGLPMPPVIMQDTVRRHVSRVSVFDKIALQVGEYKAVVLDDAEVATGKRAPSKTKVKSTKTRTATTPPTQSANRLMISAGVIIALVAVVFAIFLLSNRTGDVTLPTLIPVSETAVAQSGVIATDTPTIVMTATDVALSDTPVQAVPPTDTVPPAPTAIPSTNTPVPTFTPAPPTEPSQPTDPPPATVLYPNGRRVMLLYDEYSFYVWNASGDSIRVGSLRFEALHVNNFPLPYTFAGSRWAAFYGQLEGGRCDAIEIGRAPSLLQPAECRGYNAVVNPTADDEMVFWVVRQDAVEFRVLWDEQEVARCALGAGVCQVFLP